MNIFKINTPSGKDKYCYIATTLNKEDIISVVKPIVMVNRDDVDDYDNLTLFRALTFEFPSARINMYQEFTEINL